MSINEPNQPSMNKSPQQVQYEKIKHNIALGAVIIGPAVILLPPRKIDFYTVSLLGAAVWGADQLMKDKSGHGFLAQMQAIGSGTSDLPSDRAREVQTKLKAARQQSESGSLIDKAGNAKEEKVAEAVKALKLSKESEYQKPDWKQERDRREKEYLEEGKGYADLITDQIREVWNWGQDKAGEIKKEDERVTEARTEGEKKK